MKKRFLAGLVSLCLGLALVVGAAGTALAAGGDAWADEANRNTAWTDGAISTPQQLAQFAYLVNSGTYAGSNDVWLTQDIDLAGKEWTPIGYRDNGNAYEGTFNGNGFAVENMSVTDFAKEYGEVGLYGLFGLIGGTVKYVTVTGNITCHEFSQYYFIGGIAGYSYFGEIIGCVSAVDILVEAEPNIGASNAGGIVGANYGEVTACVNNGNISMKKGNSAPIGGITGTSVGIIDRCQNNGHLKGVTTYIGGIAGYSYADAKYYENPRITNCINTGNIQDCNSPVYLYYGGIAGYANNVAVKNCYNTGSPVDMGATYGNLVAHLNGDKNLENCHYLENGAGGLGRVNNTFIEKDPTKDQGSAQTEAAMKAAEFAAALSGAENSFIAVEGGYPALAPLPLTVKVQAQPAEAAVKVSGNGAEILPQADGTYLLVPGSYSASATAENYAPKTQEFIVTLHSDTHTVNLALEILPADYTAVDAALAKAAALDRALYQDLTTLDAAVNAVERGRDITQQTAVDAMAQAIEDAVAALVYKDADYSKVEAAIQKVEGLNASLYQDFSGVTAAVVAVERGKDIREQAAVDAMAQAIDNAVAALRYKDADYSAVDKAIDKAYALDRAEYTDFSAVKAAIDAVVRGKNITEQTAVDAMAAAIEQAIVRLERLPVPVLPLTGDSSAAGLWLALLLLSGGGAAALMLKKRARSR